MMIMEYQLQIIKLLFILHKNILSPSHREIKVSGFLSVSVKSPSLLAQGMYKTKKKKKGNVCFDFLWKHFTLHI